MRESRTPRAYQSIYSTTPSLATKTNQRVYAHINISLLIHWSLDWRISRPGDPHAFPILTSSGWRHHARHLNRAYLLHCLRPYHKKVWAAVYKIYKLEYKVRNANICSRTIRIKSTILSIFLRCLASNAIAFLMWVFLFLAGREMSEACCIYG